MSQRFPGRLKWFDRQKGYGAIMQSDGPDLTFEAGSIQNLGRGDPDIGQPLSFEVRLTERGYQAFNVKIETD
jgi:cold shock CspA family protein